MRTVGIIAEYNPFHTGHAYHLKKAKEVSGADYAVVVMSPDFVQRGEPAVFDKRARTQMALANGADLVLELPVCYATGSAEYFARGAVALLDALGAVDTLCFGGESADTRLFFETARVLLDEPEPYVSALRSLLREGRTYPQARCEALAAYLAGAKAAQPADAYPDAKSIRPAACHAAVRDSGSGGQTAAANSAHGEYGTALRTFLASPNNILGIEYCKALLKLNSQIEPLPILRTGSSYNSAFLDGPYCSATALRSRIRGGAAAGRTEPGRSLNPIISEGNASDETSGSCEPSLLRYVPENCRALFLESCRYAQTADAFLPFLAEKLLSLDAFGHILDVSPELSDRIRNLRFACIGKTFEEAVSMLKTKQVTEARIRRALLHVILGIRTEDVTEFLDGGTVFYAKTLGFRREAAPLLHKIKQNGALPLLTKNAKAPGLLEGCGRAMWDADVFASHLYRSVRAQRFGTRFVSEYELSPLIV